MSYGFELTEPPKLTDEALRQIVKRLGPLALSRTHLLELDHESILYAIPLRMVLDVRLLTREPLRRYIPGALSGAVLLGLGIFLFGRYGAGAFLSLRSLWAVWFAGLPLVLVLFGLALLVPTPWSTKYIWIDVKMARRHRLFRVSQSQVSGTEAEEFVRLIEQFVAASG